MEINKVPFKNKLGSLKNTNVFKIFYVVFLLAGAITGVVLVQKDQDIRERAAVNCSNYKTLTECDQHKPDCSWYKCELSINNAACAKTGTSTSSVCCPGGQYYCTDNLTGKCKAGEKMLWACSPSGNGYVFTECVTSNECSTLSGGTACQDNYSGKCVDDNNFCDGQNFGRVDCPTGKVCVRETTICTAPIACPTNTSCNVPSNTANAVYCYQSNKLDTKFCCPTSKPKYDSATKSCVASTGGGGGGGNPTTPPGGGGSPTTPPGDGNACNISYHTNPSVFAGFSKSGKLVLYTDPGGYEFNIALKKNSDTCSQSDNDVLLDTKNAIDSKLETGIDVTQGDKICVYAVGYEGTPGGGWIEPEGGVCQGPKGEPKDISELLHKAPEAVSVQCWGDVEIEDCDFNDFVFAFAVEEGGGGTPIEGISFKLRFQGITQKAGKILTNARLLFSGEEKVSAESVELENDNTGLYTLSFSQTIDAGTYDLIFKGNSHLQRKVTGVKISSQNQEINLGDDEKKQAKAGDVTGDNIVSLDDIARVSKHYTSLSVDVDASNKEMVASDINKDGQITIQDLALIAINWSEFSVKGDEQ